MSGTTAKQQVIEIFTAIDSVLFTIEKFALMALVLLMTGAAFFEVLLRYVFNSTLLIGISELINWTFVWIVFIGIASVYKMGNHIGITFFAEKVPPGVRRYLELAINLLLLVFMLRVITTGFSFAASQQTILTTAANIPKTYLYLAIPVGGILLSVHIVVVIIRHLLAKAGTQEVQV